MKYVWKCKYEEFTSITIVTKPMSTSLEAFKELLDELIMRKVTIKGPGRYIFTAYEEASNPIDDNSVIFSFECSNIREALIAAKLCSGEVLE